ncbi:MAG: hypothetical protein SAJ12_09295 [Jaaginema sp. PMC 1079.18]|nr:hypothetical protein [Jaaginema sp. PMC 1080.18]MEC4851195.1 hypothetical protein [Jaaginema sp. PMC 1079.18]MEC4864786.1 hypothetical protein [Jaaginema sp. PMC 1078.18]
MKIETLEFDCCEFQDLQGNWRTIRQCPLTQREELRARYLKLHDCLKEADETNTIAEIYDTNSYFQFQCHKILELCGISPHWIGLNEMAQMIFPYPDGDEIIEGVLMRLNFPASKRATKPGEEGSSYEEIIAALWGYTESLEKALELAKSEPAQNLLDILQARANQMRDANPEAKQKAMKREWQKKARAEMEADYGRS